MATYYINADSGSDAGAGTSGDPWETVAYANTTASAGDTVIVQDATAVYPIATMTMKGITWQGQHDFAAGAVFDAGNVSCIWTFPTGITESFEKITFQNYNQTLTAFPFSSNAGTNPAPTATWTNCFFRTVVVGTYYYSGLIGGLSGQPHNWTYTFDKCRFIDITTLNGAASIFCSRGTDSVTITDCIAIWSSTATNLPAKWIYRFGGTMTLDVKNNIFKNDNATSIACVTGATSGNYDYNCTNGTWSSIKAGTGNITSDPLLIDQQNEVYYLKPTSPALGTGS